MLKTVPGHIAHCGQMVTTEYFATIQKCFILSPVFHKTQSL